MTDKAPNVLILGIGNPLRSDDGLGPRVVAELAGRPQPAGVEVIDGATAGFDLALLLADRDTVVIVDAVAGSWQPGTVVRLGGGELPGAARGNSSHEAGLGEALEVVRRLGRGPTTVVLLGIAAASIEPGDELTPAVAAAVPELVEQVMAEVAAA